MTPTVVTGPAEPSDEPLLPPPAKRQGALDSVVPSQLVLSEASRRLR